MAKKAGGAAGRFVTLRSGQVVFIPKGRKSKWADVRDRIKAGTARARRGKGKGRRSKEWWAKWGNQKGGIYSPQAALEAAEANDPSALAVFANPVLRAAMAETAHPTLKRRMRDALS